MKRYLFLCPALFAVFFHACSTQPERQAASPAELELTQRLQRILEEQELMGMSVLVLDDHRVTYARGFGLADSARQLPANEQTIYRLASISKAVTATALMTLYDEGRIDLDADVSQYLDFFLRNPRYPDVPVTLRMLLSHRSSIVDGEGYGRFSAAMAERPLTLRELFTPEGEFFTEDLFLDREPGTFFTYANCPWGIIASVIERVIGERFDRFCSRRLFRPLGMNASFNVRDLEDPDRLAVLYRYDDGAWRPQADDYRGVRPPSRAGDNYRPGENGLLFGPQGSLRCSAADLANFALMHMKDGTYRNTRILEPATARLMRDAAWTYDGDNGDTYHNFYFSWGLGFHRLTRRDSMDVVFPDRDLTGHPGEAYGLISDLYFDPATGSGVIFATNGSRRSYAYGRRTTFYLPEEEVFTAVYDFLKKYRRR